MSDIHEYRAYKELLASLAKGSGSIITPYFRAGVRVEQKADDSPVTIADKKAEEYIRGRIMQEFPAHGILGEEFGSHNPAAEYQWIIDPIDGTKSFISGAFSFGTLIALLKNGVPILGCFHQPVLGEYLVGDNDAAELNGRPVKLRPCTQLQEATLLVTDHFSVEKYQNLQAFEQLARGVKLYRQWGDCYGYYLLATGYADIMADAIMSPWDTLALIPIIRGAGGVITDWQGNNAVSGNSVVAAAPEIHAAVITALNPVTDGG